MVYQNGRSKGPGTEMQQWPTQGVTIFNEPETNLTGIAELWGMLRVKVDGGMTHAVCQNSVLHEDGQRTKMQMIWLQVTK
jgi:hypothetical protein